MRRRRRKRKKKKKFDEEYEQLDISDTIQNVNPELLKKCNLDYIKFPYKLYSEIFGIKGLHRIFKYLKITWQNLRKKYAYIEISFVSQILQYEQK